MKITIDENLCYEDIEVIIKCKKYDEKILDITSKLKRSDDKKILGILENKTFLIEENDIFYFESVDKKTFIYTKTNVYQSNLRLYKLEDILASNFFRATKSSIINIDKVKSISSTLSSGLMLEMENNEKLEVSRKYKPILIEKLRR